MARPKARALDGSKPHRLLLGTPNQLVRWEYATASDARDRIRMFLSDIEKFAARHNKALETEVLMLRRDILNADFPTASSFLDANAPDRAKSWQITDEHSGLTWVVKLWKEK